jgi:hypothetical protein
MKSNPKVAEEVKSKFTLGNVAAVSSVKSGERVSNDTEPLLETASQLNKFKLNKLACEIMGLKPGGRVKIFMTGEEGIDGKYLIAVAPDEDQSAAKVLSPTGSKSLSAVLFNYAGIYSRIAQATPDAAEKSGEAFVEEGIAVDRNGTYYLNRKVAYSMVEVDNFTADEPFVDASTGVEYPKVFALISPKMEDVDLSKETKPRKRKVEEGEVEDGDVDVAVEEGDED